MTQERGSGQVQQGERQELFRQTALDQASAATGLDAYIKAVRPSTWLVAVAAVIAMVALLIWGFTAKVATTINDNGVVHEGKVVSYLTEQNRIEVSVGDRALVNNREATVVDVSQTPLSSRDAGAVAKDGEETKTFYDVFIDNDFSKFDPKAFVASTLLMGAPSGMQTTLRMPMREAARATPWAWLPALQAMMPACRCSSESWLIL
jgi:hypothetical protein